MIFRAVVCPGAPLLIPGLAEDLSAQLPELATACARAVRMLGAADRVLILCSGPRMRDAASAQQVSVVHRGGTMLSSAGITGTTGPAHFAARLPGGTDTASAAPPPGVGVVVGAALLAEAGVDRPLTAVDLGGPTAETCALLHEMQTSTDRVGLLVVAEGSASRGPTSPGGGSVGAEALDAALAAALAAGDPAALAAAAGVGPGAAARLLFTSEIALAALAEVTAPCPPSEAELLLEDASFGVGYLVAVWSWSG